MAKFQRSVFVIYTAYADCTSCTQCKLVGTSKILSDVIPCNEDCDGKTYQGGGSKEPTEDYCVILAVLQQEAVSWILFSAVVPVLSRIILRRNVLMHGLGYSK